MNIVILGPQGSGKGTQAQILSEHFKFFYFEAGNIVRELAKTDSEINQIVNERGKLLPDDVMFRIVESYLKEKGIRENILFDGYPRSVQQYELLQKLTRIDLAIVLNISDEVAIKRLSARRIDPKSGEIYNLITNPPGEDVKIEDLIQREDDKPEAIKERLSAYHNQTAPLVDKFKQEGILFEIDGTLPIEEISQKLIQEVNKHIASQRIKNE